MQNEEEKNPIDIYFDIKAGRIKLAQKLEESESEENDSESDDTKTSKNGSELLNKYLGMLRTLSIIYQHSHWKCNGSNFYGNHLLFQRLYNDSSDLVDAVAEKIIGIYGNGALDHLDQVALMASLFEKYKEDCFVSNSVEATKDFLNLSSDVYDRLKELNEMTLGMDDMIMSNASKAEEFLYLLNQVKA